MPRFLPCFFLSLWAGSSFELVLANKRRLSPFGPDAPSNHTMTYRALGKTGLRVSSLSYGAWLTFSETGQVGIDKAKEIMKAAIEVDSNNIFYAKNA